MNLAPAVDASFPPGASDAVKAEVYQRINEDYLRNIKPIYQQKCFDCHSQTVRYPWYYKIPGVKQLIDGDIREARTHLDLSNDYPFQGHGEPEEDLVALRESILSGSMPPKVYRLLHAGAQLTEEEKTRILKWIEMGLESLSKPEVKSKRSAN